jgi:DNA phosphorothioation-associated putative methyltransferase
MEIARHKAAIRRTEPSLPLKCLIRDQLLSGGASFFDYGCGYGEDVTHLRNVGYEADGWDPVHRPDSTPRPADVINLGYVLNVIEDVTERISTLREAWILCRRVLVVAARILVGGRGTTDVEFGDGIVTRLGTFQKFFTQSELGEYIEAQLETEAIPAAPGVFYIFKDETFQQQFLATRYRRKAATPRKRISELRFEEHRELLESLMTAITELGRLPEPEEFALSAEVAVQLGSLNRAFALVKRVTGNEAWDEIRQRRTEDLLVYVALARLRRRPPISKLPPSLRWDIRDFFGAYKRACEKADQLLFRAGQPEAIDEACKRSSVGKLLPNALYLHRSAVNTLEPVLRIYEGCARSYLGEVEDTNIVKLHRISGKVSYLSYPEFETDPHPALMRSVKLNLRTRELHCWDYFESKNPPILHRKETFIPSDHPLREKFARLTQQEERHGLLDDSATIGTREGWNARLQERGFALRGHRLIARR